MTGQNVGELRSSLPAPGENAVTRSYDRTSSKLKRQGAKFDGLPPKDRLMLIALSLERLLTAAIMMIEKRPAPAQVPAPTADQALALLPPGR